MVAPFSIGGNASNEITDYTTGAMCEPVDFDIAVTVSENSSAGGKGGINVYGFQVSGGKESETQHQSVSRVRFKTLVSFPDTRRPITVIEPP